MLFKRKPKKQVTTPTTTANPRQRLKNLERAQIRVRSRLANPGLAEFHRPELERKLASIGEEIEELKEIVHD